MMDSNDQATILLSSTVRHHVKNTSEFEQNLVAINCQLKQLRAEFITNADSYELFQLEAQACALQIYLSQYNNHFSDCISKISGLGNLLVLSQMKQGTVEYKQADGFEFKTALKPVQLSWLDWITAYAFALITRDNQALNAICAPDCIKTCRASEAFNLQGLSPQIWLNYCSAFATFFKQAETTQYYIKLFEQALNQQWQDNDYVRQIMIPAMGILQLLINRTYANYNQQNQLAEMSEHLNRAVKAQSEFFHSATHGKHWRGLFSLELTALLCLFYDRHVAFNIDNVYIPSNLIAGDFNQSHTQVIYHYPQLSIRCTDEARWFFELEGYCLNTISTELVKENDQLLSYCHAHNAPGVAHAKAKMFVLGANYSNSHLKAPLALDPGQLVYIAEKYADFNLNTNLSVSEQVFRLHSAIDCIQLVLDVIGQADLLDSNLLTSTIGKQVYQAEPARFCKSRMLAYQSGLKKVLSKLSRRNSVVNTSRKEMQSTSINLSMFDKEKLNRLLDELDFKAVRLERSDNISLARLIAELIAQQVLPILQLFYDSTFDELITQLIPRADDYEKVFTRAVVGQAIQVYEKFWRDQENLENLQTPEQSQSQIVTSIVPAGFFSFDNEFISGFPQGYRRIAAYLNPHRVWVAWKYLKPGQQSGLAYNGLVWIDDHWAWFPKPFKVLS